MYVGCMHRCTQERACVYMHECVSTRMLVHVGVYIHVHAYGLPQRPKF